MERRMERSCTGAAPPSAAGWAGRGSPWPSWWHTGPACRGLAEGGPGGHCPRGTGQDGALPGWEGGSSQEDTRLLPWGCAGPRLGNSSASSPSFSPGPQCEGRVRGVALGHGGTPALAAGQLGQVGGHGWCFTLLFLKSLLLSPDSFLPSQRSSPHTSKDSPAFCRPAVSIETGGRGGKWERTSQRGGSSPPRRPPWWQPTATALPVPGGA